MLLVGEKFPGKISRAEPLNRDTGRAVPCPESFRGEPRRRAEPQLGLTGFMESPLSIFACIGTMNPGAPASCRRVGVGSSLFETRRLEAGAPKSGSWKASTILKSRTGALNRLRKGARTAMSASFFQPVRADKAVRAPREGSRVACFRRSHALRPWTTRLERWPPVHPPQ